MKNKELSVGVILALFGLLMMVLVFMSSMAMIAKVILFLFCAGVVILGILIESPVLEHWKTAPEGNYPSDY